MAINYTNILITASDLRNRIGGPTANPNSTSYVTDAMLQEIIDLKSNVVSEIVERRMETLTDEQINAMDVKFDQVSVSITAGNTVAKGTIPSNNLPVIRKAFLQDGAHLDFDNDIHGTGSIYSGTGVTKKRYMIVGSDILVLPNTSGTVVVFVPERDEIRQILVGDIIDQANKEIVQEARQMIRDRVAVTTGFKQEAINEAP